MTKNYYESPSEFPKEWKDVKVNDITLDHKQGFYTNQSYSSKGIKLVRITDLLNPKLSYKTMPFLDLDNATIKQFKVLAGDFLIARSGAIGRYGVATEDVPCVFASYIIRFRFDSSRIDNYFFGYLYDSNAVAGQLLRLKHGATNININAQNIKSIRIPLPPLPEQKKIVGVLSFVDDAIRLVDLTIERTERLKKGLMQKLLTEGIGHMEFKETKIGKIPKTWKVGRIGNFTKELGSGLTPRGGSSTYLDSGVPFIRSQNVLMNRLDQSDIAFISHKTHKDMDRSKVLPGDVLLNITGASIGRVTTVPEYIKEANVNQHVCRIRLTEEFVPKFVNYYLSSHSGQRQIMSFQAGATRQGLNYKQVRSILVPLTSNQEQQDIVKILASTDNNLQLENKRREKLERIKKRLMNDLLTGKRRVGVNDA